MQEPTAFLVSPKDFAGSDMFQRAFTDGMALVEETASYLEGTGRAEAKELERDAAMLYAKESMVLTTCLMQLASWLLVHRAVREGEMSEDEARQERYRLEMRKPEPISPDDDMAVLSALPQPLIALKERTDRLYSRMALLDQRMFTEGVPASPQNPVADQLAKLSAALRG
jgi:regulator of CtrA degradation